VSTEQTQEGIENISSHLPFI